jgi:hypothetical protein
LTSFWHGPKVGQPNGILGVEDDLNFESYQRDYFVDPSPERRFSFDAIRGAALFFADFEAAVAFYSIVLGPPGYVEGDGTRGWKIGSSSLTLLRGGSGAPSNTEIPFVMNSVAEAERLQAAFIAAGATGAEPSDQLMYEPVRFCPVTDPFGTQLLIYAPLHQPTQGWGRNWLDPYVT